jgi:hypothetical protein
MQFLITLQFLIGLIATTTLASPIQADPATAALEARDTVKLNQYKSLSDWYALPPPHSTLNIHLIRPLTLLFSLDIAKTTKTSSSTPPPSQENATPLTTLLMRIFWTREGTGIASVSYPAGRKSVRFGSDVFFGRLVFLRLQWWLDWIWPLCCGVPRQDGEWEEGC